MKKLLISVGFLLLSFGVFAIEVNKTELEENQQDSIQFENYGGPHAVIESADAILGIGTKLGEEVSSNLENPIAVQPYAKYSVYHVVGSSEENALDADILFLNENAGVDHINNLRRIITGFLMAAYGYSQEDSQTLSVFITVYNAVYHGSLSNFSGKYKNAVLTYLTEDSVGLSTNWQDWAGKTQIVIPLGVIGQGTASVETSVISDENVIEALRSEEDKNIEVRESMADIKEKEASNASENAKTAQKEAAQAKKEGDKESAKENAKTASEQQKIADKKGDEAKSEREQIAKDKEEIKKESLKNEKYITSLFVADEKEKLYTLMTVNFSDGSVYKKSDLKQIRDKNIYQTDGGFIAMCGVNDKKSTVKLCLIDLESLEITKQSEETLSESGPLVFFKDLYYVILNEDGKNYLASYDKNLNLKNKSSVPVKASSPVNIYQEGILVTDSSGKPVILSLSNLNSVFQ
ncbi:P83/100 family protein [Treponema sp.]|uniref:P83/100 family protein n=1 Tax=Treponema sp. TaxID=166 RepID=UPI00388ED039